MQAKKMINKITITKEKITKIMITITLALIISTLAVITIVKVEEFKYEKFITEEIFVDEKGTCILGTYVPTGDELTHIIKKEKNDYTKKDYILYVKTEDVYTPIMRLNEKEAKNLNKFLCKSTELNLSELSQPKE